MLAFATMANAQNRSAELALANHFLSSRPEVVLATSPVSKALVETISEFASIDKIKNDTLTFYANKKGLDKLRGLNIPFFTLTPPSLQKEVEMIDNAIRAKDWDAYPTYEAYLAMMQQFEDDYPQLCQLESIGQSINGREILMLKISDKAFLDIPEPEFLYTSSMHGDELTGFVLLLRLADYLLSNYGSDEQVTKLLDEMSIYINPLSNPDGAYYGGNHTVNQAIRYNVNGIDLNRNFPDPEDGLHPDGNAWQAENIVMMDFLESRNIIHGANLHTGTEVINYPWDTWEQLHADNVWYYNLSRRYADTVHAHMPSLLGNYLTDYNNGITNGYQWYSIDGGRQDYVNYYLYGREVTMELSNVKTPVASLLPYYWEANYRSLLDYMEQTIYGFRGTITDRETGAAIAAKIEVLNHDKDNSHVYSSPVNGEYYRAIAPGNYSLRFSANGYKDSVIANIFLADNEFLTFDVDLKAWAEGIENLEKNAVHFEVFPNPVKSIINIGFSLEVNEHLAYKLFDQHGRVVKSAYPVLYHQGEHQLEIKTDAFAKGSYYLLIMLDSSSYSVKLQKI